MKKLVFAVLAAALFSGCGGNDKTEQFDTSLLTGVEAQSQDGSLSILLPDETFMMGNSNENAMEFESDEGYIYVEKATEGEEASLYDIIPENEEGVLAMFEGIDASVEVRGFNYDENNGVKSYYSCVVVNDYKEEDTSEPENFIVIENLKSDGETYYYATAEIYDESLIDKVSASLATFGDTVQ